jgi:hypothetical protein
MEPTTAKLTAAVEAIRKRIQQVCDRKDLIGGQYTKAGLIDPLLSAMGWELHEIDEVRREYRRKPQDNPMDYALFLNRTECLLIEARSLEKDLGDRKWISQNIGCAAVRAWAREIPILCLGRCPAETSSRNQRHSRQRAFAPAEWRPCFQFARRQRSRHSGVRGPVGAPPCIRQHV